jgi:hypothetical protein
MYTNLNAEVVINPFSNVFYCLLFSVTLASLTSCAKPVGGSDSTLQQVATTGTTGVGNQAELAPTFVNFEMKCPASTSTEAIDAAMDKIYESVNDACIKKNRLCHASSELSDLEKRDVCCPKNFGAECHAGVFTSDDTTSTFKTDASVGNEDPYSAAYLPAPSVTLTLTFEFSKKKTRASSCGPADSFPRFAAKVTGFFSKCDKKAETKSQ